MDELERLVAIEDIRVLKARYFRFLDTKDWDGMLTVFTDDAVIDVTEDSGRVVEGAATFVGSLRSILAEVESVHHGHMPEISIVSSTDATAIWAMDDHLRWVDGGTGAIHELRGAGHYHETYVKTADGWKIATMRLSRLRRDTT